MNRHEKIAWFNLAVIAVSILLFLVLYFILKESHPIALSLKASCAAFGVCGLLGLSQTLFRKEEWPEGTGRSIFDPEMDERDVEISRRAAMHGFAIFWVVFVFLVVGIWGYLHKINDSSGLVIVPVDIDFMPLVMFPFFIIIWSIQSLSTIIQHRRGSLDDNRVEDGFVPRWLAWIVSTVIFSVFLISSAYLFLQGEVNMAFQQAAISFGMIAMVIRETQRRQHFGGSDKKMRRFMYIGRIFNIIFTFFYSGLLLTFLWKLFELGALRWPSLFILLFVTIIFYRTVLSDLIRHFKERRHEQA